MTRAYEAVPEPAPYGELGTLTFDPDGAAVQCHVCGVFRVRVDLHALRTHGMTPAEYREQFGLNRAAALVASTFRENARRSAVALKSERHVRAYRFRGERVSRTSSARLQHRRALSASLMGHPGPPLVDTRCKECGVSTRTTSSQAVRGVRCAACQRTHRLTALRERAARARAVAREGAPHVCADCGVLLAPSRPGIRVPQRCALCRVALRRARDRARAKRPDRRIAVAAEKRARRERLRVATP